MTYEEIKEQHPSEFKARQDDKLYYRYPGMGGESYIDVIHRLQSMIIELERMNQSCLIVTHRVVLRILLGYLLEWSQTQMPHMLVPIHTYVLSFCIYIYVLTSFFFLLVFMNYVQNLMV